MTTKTKTQTATKTQTPAAAKPKKIQTKTEVRNAAAQADKLIRGIDNDVAAAKRLQEQADKKLEKATANSIVVRSLIAGISNAALTQQAAPAPKPAAKPQAKPAAKPAPAKKPEAKVAAKKPAAKAAPKAAKPAAKASAASSDGARPDLDDVARDIISKAGKSLTAAAIYHGCQQLADKKGFKVWSRQSLYNQLKNPAKFSKTGDGAEATFDNVTQAASSKVTDAEADKLIKKVEKDSVAASVV